MIYVRPFPSAKVKCMKEHMECCLWENKPDVFLTVGTNVLASENNAERIAKSIVDLAKNFVKYHCSVSISSIIYLEMTLNLNINWKGKCFSKNHVLPTPNLSTYKAT